MFDFESLLLDPVYDTLGSAAVLTDKGGQSLPVTVLDHRDGIELTTVRGGSVNVMLPGINAEEALVYVRHSECPAQPIGWKLRLDGEEQSYDVRSAKLKGRPGRGEWVLTLQKA